jgi:UDP-N-acetylmuramate dehydrogenase
MRSRREKQPLEYPSAGSFFRRPEGHFAGALIEKSGLKGCRVGEAQVSEKHAGFIINLGGATCSDVRRLAEMVRERVYKDHGVLLQPEVCYIG